MLFFIAAIVFRILGYEVVSKVLMWIFFIVFLVTYCLAAKFVFNFNRKAWNRCKAKKYILTESLLDDDKEDYRANTRK